MAKRPDLTVADGDRKDDRPTRLKKVNRDLLAKIKLARKEAVDHANQATTHQLKSQAAETAMRLFISEGLSGLGVQIVGNAVCLDCGAVRAEPQQGQPVQPCPGCGAV